MLKIFKLITLIAFITGLIAPACGFAWGGKYSVITICTDKGFESRVIADNDQDNNAPSPLLHEKCQFCFSNHHVVAFLPPAPAQKTQIIALEKHIFSQHDVVLLSKFHSKVRPRAPPFLV